MTAEGVLQGEGLREFLRSAEAERASGILTVQGEREILGITLAQGRVVSVDAVNQSLEELIGSQLVERAIFSRAEVEALVADREAGGPRLTERLVAEGVLEQNELLAMLREKSLWLCRRALQWEQGRFRFYPGEEVAFDSGIEPIAVAEVLNGARTGPTRAAEVANVATWLPDLDLAAVDLEIEDAEEDETTGARRARSGSASGLAVLAALGAGCLLAWTAWRTPTRALLPLAAHERFDHALSQQQSSAFYLKMDRAAKTHYLLEGGFPDGIADLIDEGLLGDGDLHALRHQRLAYAEAPASYLVRLEDSAEGSAAMSHRTETVAGHFLLDPDFVVPEVIEVPALVLLD